MNIDMTVASDLIEAIDNTPLRQNDVSIDMEEGRSALETSRRRFYAEYMRKNTDMHTTKLHSSDYRTIFVLSSL